MFNQLEILSDEQSEKLYTIRRYIKDLKVFVLLIPEELTAH